MKAAQINRYGDPSVIQISDVPVPSLAANQVLIEVKAASLNPFDTTMRSGRLKDAIPLTLPVTLGGDIAGVVTEVSDGIDSVSVGDSVYGQANVVASNSGAFAEYAATKTSQIAMMPKNLTYTEAASLPLVGVSALQALGEHLNLQAGQKIFIHGGAGGIGTIALQIAKHIGAYIVTTAKSEDADYVRALGANEVIDYTTTDFSEVLSDFDAVFDTVGGEEFAKTFRILKSGSTAVSMVAQPDSNLAAQLGITALTQSTHITTERLAKLAQLVENGAITPQLGEVYPLTEISQAFAKRESGHVRGKIVLELT